MSNFEYSCPSTPSRSTPMRLSMDSPYQKNTTPDSNRRYSSPIPSSNTYNPRFSLNNNNNSNLSNSPAVSLSDRYIPHRASTNLEEGLDILNSIDSYIPNPNQRFSTSNINNSNTSTRLSNQSPNTSVTNKQEIFNQLLRQEILGEQYNTSLSPSDNFITSNESDSSHSTTPTRKLRTNLLRYSQSNTPINTSRNSDILSNNLSITSSDNFTLSSVKNTPTKPLRKISKAPYKVLDAPSLYDDYYLNLLDWSSQNVLAVALGNSVSLWSACTSKVSILCDLSPDAVTSVTWNLKGDQLAIGTNNGKVSIWDITENRIVREIHAHSSRVGVMSWSSQLLASGSRDRHIYCYDLRIGSTVNNNSNTSNNDSNNDFTTYSSPHRYSVFNDASYTTSLSNLNTTMFSSQMTNYNNNTTSSPTGGIISSVSSPNRNNYIVFDFNNHKQEVCGLKWSFDEKLLASGGNDNKLFIWSVNQSRNNEPLYEFSDHGAAVKAVAWSPHQHGLIASGGGTADRHIRFWNALNGVALHKVDTGSQVCNLLWSKNVNELVSTHGYSLNQVIIWKYPTMQKLATLTGHTLRVLYLAGSPDGKSIVTGAGDETLRFWNVFPGSKNRSGHQIGPSVLIPSALDIR